MVERQFRPKQKNKSNIVKICTKFLCVVGWVVIWAGMENSIEMKLLIEQIREQVQNLE